MEITTTLLPAAVAVVDWLELPEDLITTHILSKLSCITDFVRFGAVCVKWQSIFLNDEDCTRSLRSPQLLLLMIPIPPLLLSQEKNKNNNKNKCGTRHTISWSFYRVTDGKIFNGLLFEMTHDRYVRGSGHGWLITVDQKKNGCYIQLMNPFLYPNTATKEIKLPPPTAHPYNYREPETRHLRKAILSADPVLNPKDFMVMAIFGKFTRLSFCKFGDKAWTPIRDSRNGRFDDVIYYKGKFYAVHCDGTVVVCNVANCMTETFAGPPVTEFESYMKYLVISSGQLLQVHRNVHDNGITIGFKVFKLLKGGQDTEWVEVNDLSGHVFFLGDNASISISASDYPGCKPNSIYYTHDNDNIKPYWSSSEDAGNGAHDLGVFNLENGSFEKHYPADLHDQIRPAPIWIEPTLKRSTTRTHYL